MLSELRSTFHELAATARTDRVDGWSATIGIVVGTEPWLTCTVTPNGVQVPHDAGAIGTKFALRGPDALRRWLVGGVDYTHLVRSGDMTIDGVSFDVLLLSKVLGLRPDRKIGARR